MTTWFHHDPASGRAGPFSTDILLARYRSRLINGDTLVWREGLPEWQPLQRAMADLDTALGPQDASMPPPLPTHVQAPAAGMPAANRPHAGMRRASAPKQGMSGCLIALIVAAVVAVPMLAILAAIALPAYRDYTIKAKVTQAIGQSRPIQDAIVEHVGRTRNCPSNGDAGFEEPGRFATPLVESVEVGTNAAGACAYALTLPFVRDNGQAATVVMAMGVANNEYVFEFDCQASTLDPLYRPASCRTSPEESR
jgi:type IV pilus assembly protein PilA